MFAENLRLIGKLSKLHGFEGEAMLITDISFPKKIEKTEWVFLIIDGLPVPFFVLRFSIRNESLAIIKLEDITSVEKMEKYLGRDVFIEETRKKSTRKLKPDKSIEGYKVIDKTRGEIGIANDIINYNNNYLLQVFNNNTEILIPVNDEIIIEINDHNKTILVDSPEGLLDLYI
jgi:16S rRNA processing protein RimM